VPESTAGPRRSIGGTKASAKERRLLSNSIGRLRPKESGLVITVESMPEEEDSK
jgi:hypothetical protein